MSSSGFYTRVGILVELRFQLLNFLVLTAILQPSSFLLFIYVYFSRTIGQSSIILTFFSHFILIIELINSCQKSQCVDLHSNNLRALHTNLQIYFYYYALEYPHTKLLRMIMITEIKLFIIIIVIARDFYGWMY